MQPISATQWAAAIALIASKASLISRRRLNEIPDNIEDSFKPLNLNLLPGSRKDFQATMPRKRSTSRSRPRDSYNF